jgi:hypothetical protein
MRGRPSAASMDDEQGGPQPQPTTRVKRVSRRTGNTATTHGRQSTTMGATRGGTTRRGTTPRGTTPRGTTPRPRKSHNNIETVSPPTSGPASRCTGSKLLVRPVLSSRLFVPSPWDRINVSSRRFVPSPWDRISSSARVLHCSESALLQTSAEQSNSWLFLAASIFSSVSLFMEPMVICLESTLAMSDTPRTRRRRAGGRYPNDLLANYFWLDVFLSIPRQ